MTIENLLKKYEKPTSAERYTKEYNLHTLKDLMKLTHEDLIKIDRIADKTAQKIIGAIHG